VFDSGDPFDSIARFVIGSALYVLLGLVPTVAALYAIYFIVTLPMRRTERGRIFLDLLELGLKEGRTPEGAVTDAAASRDTSLGARFHLLAARLEHGSSLSQGLEKVPRLLPPQVCAMLRTGERIGDVGKVLPACSLLLRDGVSQVRGALNYLLLLAFIVTPFAVVLPVLIRVKVLPSFRAVCEGVFEGAELPPFTRFVFGTDTLALCLQIAVLALIWFLTLAYIAGPRLQGWLGMLSPAATAAWDSVLWRLPWRRKRLQRDFSTMLALLLEAEVPEAEAIRLAGEATANTVVQRRANRAIGLLSQGVALPEALRAVDDCGEFRWRLANALRSGFGFVRALAGWHEALDAKAFQLEQTAAQVTTTFLVLLNGAIVGCIVLGIFMALIKLVNMATLW
jgi:type II secretory pathway component PulF